MSVQVLFLAAKPAGTPEQHLGEEARAIHDELRRANPRAQLSLVPRLAARPLDLLRELRALRPAIVHFTGDAEGDGIWLVDHGGQPIRVGQDTLSTVFSAAGKSVQIVVLSGCATDSLADALCKLVRCIR